MLKISTKGQYALLIMTELAEQEADKYVPLKLLSHRHNLSVKYLEQILIRLSKAGLVVGLRGNNGGYKLADSPEKYTAGQILRAMEGDLNPKAIASGRDLLSVGNDAFWDEFNKVINDYVNSITLEDIVQKNREFVGFEYCI
ncbi:MAG: Rrf2 family transcriptional regulator [Treponema sp.]|nr:Rrf2 family transcriptional regulator [Treponema sp.]MBR0487982.1 Rrf2 family transcriptional regulator [Treponema sp.]